MFFMVFLTGMFSSEYLVNLLLRANLLLFLGADINTRAASNQTLFSDTDILINDEPLHVGSFYYEHSENFENYLTELGVGYFLRKLALLAFPIVTITRCLIKRFSVNWRIEMSYFSRKCTDNSSSLVTSQNFDEECIWTIKTDAGLKSHSVSFHLNEWVDDVTMDGRNIKTKFHTEDPNKIIEFQTSNGVNTTLTRQFFVDRMEVSMNVNSVNASSLFRRNS